MLRLVSSIVVFCALVVAAQAHPGHGGPGGGHMGGRLADIFVSGGVFSFSFCAAPCVARAIQRLQAAAGERYCVPFAIATAPR